MQRAALYLLLLVVAAAAAVLSFDALRGLALLCGFTPELAWLLPVTIDAGAGAASIVWLGTTAPGARSYGRALAIALLASSVGGNALGHGLSAFAIRPHWLVVVGVSAIAPAVLGALVHLVVLAGRPAKEELDSDDELAAATKAMAEQMRPFEPTAADRDKIRPIALPASDDALIADVREWAVDRAAAGADRPSRDDMIEAYGIGATRARKLRRFLAWADESDEADRVPTGAPA